MPRCSCLSPRDTGNGNKGVRQMVACQSDLLVVYVERDWNEVVLDVWSCMSGQYMTTVEGLEPALDVGWLASMHENELCGLVAMPDSAVVATIAIFEALVKLWCVDTGT